MVACGLVVLLCIASGIVCTVQALNGAAPLFLRTDHSPGQFASKASTQITDANFDGVFALSIEGVQSPGLMLYAWTMGIGFVLMTAACTVDSHSDG